MSDEHLLEVRLCDLDVGLEGTMVEDCIRQIHQDLADRGLRFRPHFWLSDDWFSPHGVPGVAVPFYLAHPRLRRLERSQMLEVEGGTKTWCMRLLRHETGHAIEHAYRLTRRRRRQQLFGRSSDPYPEIYSPKPYSRRYVVHLDAWYAQSHPDEDFAETFAVWFTRGSMWRKRYAGWPALKKLEYMDELMGELEGVKPPVTTRARVEPLHRIDKTLRRHYDEKRERHGLDYPDVYSRDLRRLFSDSPEHRRNRSAAAFIRKHRKDLRRTVARWTGTYQYTIDQVISDMIERCRDLDLRLPDADDEQPRFDLMVLLSVQAMNYVHGGRHYYSL